MQKKLILSFAAGLALTAAAPRPQPAPATHRIIPAGDIAWGPAPASLPTGAQTALLYGNPAGDGLFAMRLKVPKGYRLPLHTHPGPEIVTVLAGKVRLVVGSMANAPSAPALTAGSFYSTEPGTPHTLLVDEDSVIQVNSRGPWGITYIDRAVSPGNKPR
jgi:quercetin dioxygenase-like cupin family protein